MKTPVDTNGLVSVATGARMPSLVALVFSFVFIGVQSAWAAEWASDSSGAWNVNGNWANPSTFPNGVDAVADFSKVNLTATRNVNPLGQPITIGTLIVGDINNGHGYDLNNATTPETLTFEVSSGTALFEQTATAGPNSGSASDSTRMRGPVALNSDLRIRNLSATLNLIFTGNGSISGSGWTVYVEGQTGESSSAGLIRFAENNSFARLVIESGVVNAQTSDQSLGAVPGSFMDDALTLDGGGLRTGLSANNLFTIHANRGVRLGPAGGGFSVNENRNIAVNSVISGQGDLRVYSASAGGAAILNELNIYRGDTHVTPRAILRLSRADALPTATKVRLTSDSGSDHGKLDLNFSGGQTVAGLYFDGVEQGHGTYGATGSGADTINDDWFTGSGRLQVRPPAAGPAVGGARLWLKADDLALDHDDPVATWADASGLGYDAEQGTSASRPLLKAGVLNGLPAVRFDGVTNRLDLPVAFANGFSGINTPITIYYVGRMQDSSQNNQTIFSLFADNRSTLSQNAFLSLRYTSNLGQLEFGTRGDQGTGATTYWVTNAIHDSYDIRTAIREVNGNGLLRLGGVQVASHSIAQGTAQNFAYATIGAQRRGPAPPDIGGYLNGDLAEMLVYPGVHTLAQRIIVENYLGAKYNLALEAAGQKYTSLNGTYRHHVTGVGRASDGSRSVTGGQSGLQLTGSLSGNDTWILAGGDGQANELVDGWYWRQRWNLVKVGSVADTDEIVLTFDWTSAGLAAEFDALVDQTVDGFKLLAGSSASPITASVLRMAADSVEGGNQRLVNFVLTAEEITASSSIFILTTELPVRGTLMMIQ